MLCAVMLRAFSTESSSTAAERGACLVKLLSSHPGMQRELTASHQSFKQGMQPLGDTNHPTFTSSIYLMHAIIPLPSYFLHASQE